MAKTKQVIEEFRVGKNIYAVGKVLSFSDELAEKHKNCLADVVVEDISAKKLKAKEKEE